jgi:hypothetical protein
MHRVLDLKLGHRRFLVGLRASFPTLPMGYRNLHGELGHLLGGYHSEYLHALRRLYSESTSTPRHESDHEILRWLDLSISRGHVIVLEVYHSTDRPAKRALTKKLDIPTGGLSDGARSRTGTQRLSDLSSNAKLTEVLLRAMSKMPNETKNAFKQMVSPEALKTMAAIFAVWGASHAVGVGEAVDVILIGVGYVFVGAAAFDGAKSIYEGVKGALEAKNDHQLDIAAAAMAQGITTLGVNSLVILLTHRKIPSATPAAQVDEAAVVAQWRYYIDNLKLPFNGEESRATLWARIGDRAEAAALKDGGRLTLNRLLRRTDFMERMETQFGGDETATTKQIWTTISEKYVSQLKGKVVVYTNQTKLGTMLGSPNEIGTPKEAILISELWKIFDSNTLFQVDEIIVKDLDDASRTRTLSRDDMARFRRFEKSGAEPGGRN